MGKTLVVIQGEDDEEPLRLPYVLLVQGPKFLIAGGVQDVQQADLAVNDKLLSVGVSDGGVVFLHEHILIELLG